jgi:hypothetical protein
MRLNAQIFSRVSVISLLAFSMASTGQAVSNWDVPSSELAKKIIERVGNQSTVTVAIRNASSLGEDDAADAGGAIRAALGRQTIQLVEEGQAKLEVLVTLSENFQSYLWIAEIQNEGSRDVVMVQVDKPQSDTSGPAPVTLMLQKIPLLVREEPILDVALLEPFSTDPERLVVLGPENIAIYQRSGTGIVLQTSARILHGNTWPRDIRGRIIRQPSGIFKAYLPGVNCNATITPSLSVDCHASDEPWPLMAGDSNDASAPFVSDRNYFDGHVRLQNGEEMIIPPFFAATVVGTVTVVGSESQIWAVSGVDGRTQFYGPRLQNSSISDTWGSELASIHTGCASGHQILADHLIDPSGTDSIEAYELTNRTAVAVSAQADFSGPIIALWPSSGEPAATAISQNIKTDRYEAFRIVVACSR